MHSLPGDPELAAVVWVNINHNNTPFNILTFSLKVGGVEESLITSLFAGLFINESWNVTMVRTKDDDRSWALPFCIFAVIPSSIQWIWTYHGVVLTFCLIKFHNIIFLRFWRFGMTSLLLPPTERQNDNGEPRNPSPTIIINCLPKSKQNFARRGREPRKRPKRVRNRVTHFLNPKKVSPENIDRWVKILK